MWESFPQGGCWILTLRFPSPLLDRNWEELVFSVIGEQFCEPDIVGIGCTRRGKESKLSIWHRTQQNLPVRGAIHKKLKEVLTLERDGNETIDYKTVKVSMQDGSSFVNAQTYQFVASQPPSPPKKKKKNDNNNNNNNNNKKRKKRKKNNK